MNPSNVCKKTTIHSYLSKMIQTVVHTEYLCFQITTVYAAADDNADDNDDDNNNKKKNKNNIPAVNEIPALVQHCPKIVFDLYDPKLHPNLNRVK